MTAVVLDTCAILWLAAGIGPSADVLDVIETARRDDAVIVSPISAWEIAQKEKRRPGALGLQAAPIDVFRRIADQPGVRIGALTPAILVASVALDGIATKDPADRMIVATALAHRARVVTGDRAILDFATDGLDYSPK